MKPKLLSEFVGVFLLVSLGYGSIAAAASGAWNPGPYGVSAVFGVVVAIAIQFLGPFSIHFNPAVSAALGFMSWHPWREVWPFIAVQFAAALVSRFWAGRSADAHGAKRAVVSGLAIASGTGLLYLGSLAFAGQPAISVIILLAGRAVLGVAESAIITGALSWGLALLGTENTGRVMSWVGTALWGAFAAGAPAGSALYGSHGWLPPRQIIPASSCNVRQFSRRSCLALSSVSLGLPSLSKCLAKRPSVRAKRMKS